MRRGPDLKGLGYLISALSVVLLAIPAFKFAARDAWTMAALAAGMALSVCGMLLRWRSHQLDRQEREKDRQSGRN